MLSLVKLRSQRSAAVSRSSRLSGLVADSRGFLFSLDDPSPAPGERDILAQDRASRSRFRMFHPFAGRRGGLIILALCTLLGGFLYLYPRLTGEVGFSPPTGGYASPFPVSPQSADVPVSPAVMAQAHMFGEVVGSSSNGMPLIEDPLTGDVRELTPVEADFPAHLPYASTGNRNVLWTPGPRGWGVWWQDQETEARLNARNTLDRGGWRVKQEQELSAAVAAVRVMLQRSMAFDFEVWAQGVAPDLVYGTDVISQRYDVVPGKRYWSAVPARWVCSSFVEQSLNLGVSQGCPSVELEQALAAVWYDFGEIHGYLARLGRYGVRVDAMPTGQVYESAALLDLAHIFEDMRRAVLAFQESLDDLATLSWNEELPISVELFQLPAEF